MHVGFYAYLPHVRIPLGGFLIQLEDLSPDWDDVERSLCKTLFLGPRGWAEPAVLAQQPTLGLPAVFPNARAASLAAKCRVCRWENLELGGLNVGRRSRALTRNVAAFRWLDRRVAWKMWAGNNLIKTWRGPRTASPLKLPGAGLPSTSTCKGRWPWRPPKSIGRSVAQSCCALECPMACAAACGAGSTIGHCRFFLATCVHHAPGDQQTYVSVHVWAAVLRAAQMGSKWLGRLIVPRRRCIGDAVRCGVQVSPRRRRRCIASVAGASPMHPR